MELQSHDPVVTDGSLYKTIFENERVRVLEYRDQPGDQTHPHRHPDSVMFTLTSFQRRVSSGGRAVDLDMPAGVARWIGAQEHTGENTGGTETHVIFVELKESGPFTTNSSLGPSA